MSTHQHAQFLYVNHRLKILMLNSSWKTQPKAVLKYWFSALLFSWSIKKKSFCRLRRNPSGYWVILIFSGPFKPYKYQDNLSNIALFFTFFKGYINVIIVICNNTKESFLWEPEKTNVKFHKMTAYSWNFRNLPVFLQFLWNLTYIFSGSHEK